MALRTLDADSTPLIIKMQVDDITAKISAISGGKKKRLDLFCKRPI